MAKVPYTSLSLPTEIVEKLRAIGSKLTPKSSVASLAAHILEEAAAYIDSDAETLPPLTFIHQVRDRLGKHGGKDVTPETESAITLLEARLTAIEATLRKSGKLTVYTHEEEPALRVADAPLKKRKP